MSDVVRALHLPHSYIDPKLSAADSYSQDMPHVLVVADDVIPLVLDSIGKVPYDGKGAFTIGDFGAADGSSSVNVWRQAINVIRKKHGKDTEVSIVYEDQAVNDFRTLFQILNGCLPGHSTFLTEYDGVYVTASGTSFFDQCLPSNSVHFGFSTLAMQYLSERPCKLSDAMHHTVSSIKEEVAQYAAQAAEDWQRILLNRARELMPGGRMVCILTGCGEDGALQGDAPAPTGRAFWNLGDILQELVQEGRITQEEFEETNLVQYCRTEAEVTAPFEDLTSPVYKTGLRLVTSHTKLEPCIYHRDWMKLSDEQKGDRGAARAHARRILRFYRGWLHSTVLAGLLTSRTEEERKSIAEDVFRRFEERIVAAPSDHGFRHCHIYVCFEKSSTGALPA